MVTKIFIANTVVEFGIFSKKIKNIYRGGVVLTLGVPFLIRLLNFFLQPGYFNTSTEH